MLGIIPFVNADIRNNILTFLGKNQVLLAPRILLLLLPLVVVVVVVVEAVVVVLEMRLIQSSFDTFLRIPNGNGAPIHSKGAVCPSLAWGTEEKLKETDKIHSAFGNKRVDGA